MINLTHAHFGCALQLIHEVFQVSFSKLMYIFCHVNWKYEQPPCNTILVSLQLLKPAQKSWCPLAQHESVFQSFLRWVPCVQDLVPTIQAALTESPFAMWWVGLLYAIQNLLYFVCLQYTSAAAYQVLSRSTQNWATLQRRRFPSCVLCFISLDLKFLAVVVVL